MRRKRRRENSGKLKSRDLDVGCEMDRHSVMQEMELVGPPKRLDMKGEGKRSIKIRSLNSWVGGYGNLRWEKQIQVESQSSDLATLSWMSSQLSLELRPKYLNMRAMGFYEIEILSTQY